MEKRVGGFMDYKEALQYIHGTLKFGSKLGLQNTEELLARLGNPERSFKVVHIAGTNGKGSVTAMTANILFQAGYKVGMFISPYLERFTERIQVNFDEISQEDLARLTGIVKEKISDMVKEGYNHPTEFEVVTAIGFLHFAQQQVDFAVVEVGLGGRLDATNVVDPLVTIITSISYEHMDILGHTLKEIAFEKGGIIKNGKPVVSYPQDEEARVMLEDLAYQRNSPYHQVSPDQITLKSSSFSEQHFDFIYQDKVLEDIIIHLPGDHQVLNAACALTGIMVLKELGYSVDDSAIYSGMKATRWPGRMEKIKDKPMIILDGAHNPSGAQALADAIRKYFPDKKVYLVLGVFKDKDVKSVARILCPIADNIVVTMSDSPRAMDAAELSEIVKAYHTQITVKPLLHEAIAAAIEYMAEDDILVISGSLHLVGEARALIGH